MTTTTVLPAPSLNGNNPPGVTVRTVDVTPELAAAWLARNNSNRNLNENHVIGLAGAMLRGEWRQNGDTVRFASDGRLLDGQHRLAAVVRSGRTISMLVVEGLSSDSQITMDTNRKRSFADHLKMRGESEYTSIAALLTKIYRWETGQIRSVNRPPTYDQLLALYERTESLDASVKAAQAIRRQLPVSTSVLSLAYWLFSGIDSADAEFFAARLRDGAGLVEGDAIFTLRKFILNTLTGTRGRNRVDDALLLAVTVKAWNGFRTGTPVRTLAWRSGGSRPEAFPEPV